MPSRLASGAYRSRVSRANPRNRASFRRASAACRSARPAASARCAGRRPWPAASCAAFPLRTALGGGVAGVPSHHAQSQRPRALHQPRHFLAKRGGDGSLRTPAQHGRSWAGGQQGRRGWRHRCACRPDADHARSVRSQRLRSGPAGLEALGPGHGLVDQRQAVGIQASPASCRQEASKGVGASGTGEADMTGKLGGLQGNDQNISTLYTSVCPH